MISRRRSGESWIHTAISSPLRPQPEQRLDAASRMQRRMQGLSMLIRTT